MRKALLIITFSLLAIGCNMSPNKEARIQKLETETQQTIDKINNLKLSIQKLEVENKQLKTRIFELEKSGNTNIGND